MEKGDLCEDIGGSGTLVVEVLEDIDAWFVILFTLGDLLAGGIEVEIFDLWN